MSRCAYSLNSEALQAVLSTTIFPEAFLKHLQWRFVVRSAPKKERKSLIPNSLNADMLEWWRAWSTILKNNFLTYGDKRIKSWRSAKFNWTAANFVQWNINTKSFRPQELRLGTLSDIQMTSFIQSQYDLDMHTHTHTHAHTHTHTHTHTDQPSFPHRLVLNCSLN